jgi:hypothetical protein
MASAYFEPIGASLRFAVIVIRRILGFGFGVPWVLLFGAIAYLSLRIASVDPSQSGGSGCHVTITAGFLIASCLAALAPIVYFGHRRGRPIDWLVATRPIHPVARSTGPALGTAAAATLLFVAMIVIADAIHGLPSMGLRDWLGDVALQPTELTAPGSQAVGSLTARAGDELRLAPRIGFMGGYGDPNPATIRVSLEGPGSPLEREATLRGREPVYLALESTGTSTLRVTRVGPGPRLRWFAGSAGVVSPPQGLPFFLARLGPAAALALLQFAAAAACFAAWLQIPIACACSATWLFVALASPLDGMRRALGVAPLLGPASVPEGCIPPMPVLSVVQVLSITVLLFIVAGLKRRRPTP